MSYQNILVETRGKVGIIRLNRPQVLNALNAALVSELNAAVQAFEADASVACLLITGSEKAFAAGADIKEMAEKTYMDAFMGDFAAAWDPLARARKPVIAAVAGFALGGGCELAMMCDIVIAADNAQFGQPEIKLGVMPGMTPSLISGWPNFALSAAMTRSHIIASSQPPPSAKPATAATIGLRARASASHPAAKSPMNASM